jgi:hypothetical protein
VPFVAEFWVIGPVTDRDRFADAVWAGSLESVAVTMKLDMPAGPIGVPVIAPVLGSRVRPAGSDPVVTCQESGGVPPDAATVAPAYDVPTAPSGSEDVVTASPTAATRFTPFDTY